MSDSLLQRIEEALWAYLDTVRADGYIVDGIDGGRASEAILASLELSQEHRTLADGMGGISTNYKTGVTTTYSKPCTQQSRWVTPWSTDSPAVGRVLTEGETRP